MPFKMLVDIYGPVMNPFARAPAAFNEIDSLFLEQIREDVVSKTRAKILRIMQENDYTLDASKAYLEPYVVLLEPLAQNETCMQLLKQLKTVESFEEFETIYKQLHGQFLATDTQSVLTGAAHENFKGQATGQGAYAIREFPPKQVELLHNLRELNLLKPWLSCLFTPGSEIRNDFTTPACQPWGPALIWVQESRMWSSNQSREQAETVWMVMVYTPVGTRVYTLRWDKTSKCISTELQDYTKDEHLLKARPGDRPRMIYMSQEKLEFFSGSGLPLHPWFFDGELPSKDAFGWAEAAQQDPEFWNHLRFEIAPRMPELMGVIRQAVQFSGISELAEVVHKHAALFENPEFFLEFILNLSAMPRSQGLEHMEGMGGIISGLLETAMGRRPE